MMAQTKIKCGSSQHEEQLLRKYYNFGNRSDPKWIPEMSYRRTSWARSFGTCRIGLEVWGWKRCYNCSAQKNSLQADEQKPWKKPKLKGHWVYYVATVSNAVDTFITWLSLILEQAELLSLVTSIRVAKGQFQHLEIDWVNWKRHK